MSDADPFAPVPAGGKHRGRAGPLGGERPAAAVADVWDELVTVALLGTDRRDPPELDGPLGDVVADTARTSPSGRMLALVAASVAVRRAGFVPGPPRPPVATPPADERPSCPPAAADRWRHVVASWPVLEDEWMLTLIANGWRVSSELVPAMLRRHRRDPVRRVRVLVAAGPVAEWLTEHVPDLAAPPGSAGVSPEALGELPPLPIPPELAALLDRPGAESGQAIAGALEAGALAAAHRAVLVNLVARVRPDALGDFAAALAAVDPDAPGHGLAATLADLATTRHRMLAELVRP